MKKSTAPELSRAVLFFEVKDDRKTAAGQAAASIFAVNNALASYNDVEVKRWLSEHRLVKLHKRLGHALALPSLAAVLRPLKNSGQVPAARQGPSAVCAA